MLIQIRHPRVELGGKCECNCLFGEPFLVAGSFFPWSKWAIQAFRDGGYILLVVPEGEGGKGEQKVRPMRRRRGGPLSGWEPKGEEAKKEVSSSSLLVKIVLIVV